jgi:phosphoglycerate dehydrogenase-like enzyme
MTLKVAVSGIPRGYQSPKEDGNWLKDKHKQRILDINSDIELLEIPADKVLDTSGIEVLLAEGGNRTHYSGEIDWEDYQKFFTPSLKWVQLCSTGFSDNITTEIIRGEVTLTNAPGLHTIPIAESVLAAMLEHAKCFKQRREDQKSHAWNQVKANELYGKTALLIGLGNIGKRVAHLCKSFNMKVIGTKRRVTTVDNVDEVFPSNQILEYLPEADYVVVAAPLTSETEHLLGRDEFEAMKKTAYFINIGRGKITHESSLIKALEDNWISGAYLDVFEVEPLPENHVLWDLPNVFLVPHDSHSSPYIGDRVIDIFTENLERYIQGKELLYVCSPERGY